MTGEAIRLERPGRFETVPDSPGELAKGFARVRVRRIGICGTDIHAFHGRQPFFEYPRILGHELAGEVVSLHGDSPLSSGDLVAVEPYLNDPDSPASRRGRSNCCESLQVLGVHCDGGMRPYLDVPIRKLHPGGSADADQLALVEMLGIGRHAVNRSGADAEDRALVLGAGPIGLSVLTFLRTRTSSIVVADLDEKRLDFCRNAFGVEETIRVQPGIELEKELRNRCGGGLPDLVFDATGNRESMHSTFGIVAHGGRIVFVGLFQGDVTFSDPDFHRREVTLLASRNATTPEFRDVIASIGNGSVDTAPWITHRLALTDVPTEFPRTIDSEDLRKGMIECDD